MRHSSLFNFAWLASAFLVGGCSAITALDRWTFEDENTEQMDAGPVDASPGEQDAGPSCTSELTECAGECVHLDSSPEHCGACGSRCPSPPHTVAVCSAGSCGFECVDGFADCNGEPEDGCEVDIGSDPLNCGGCTMACETTVVCREGACRPRLLWARSLGDTGNDTVTGVAFDPGGNIYITGYFQGTINLGGADLIAAGGWDIVVASFTASGEHRWSVRGGGSSSDQATAIAFDPSGKVHVTGYFYGSASFGGSTLMSNGSGDIFIASFDAATGSHLASHAWGGASLDSARSIAVDPSSNIYVTGQFSGTVNFGMLPLTSAGDTDIFIASYPPGYGSTGNARWTSRFGSAGSDVGNDVAVDASGNSYVTGHFEGSVSFGGSTFISEGRDVFVASFNSSGVHRWSTAGGGNADDVGYGVALDNSGNAFVTGNFTGSASFGGAPLGTGGSTDTFLASYEASGAHRWSRRAGGPDGDFGFSVAASPSGEINSTGSFVENADFGGGALMSSGQAGFVAVHEGVDGVHRASLGIGGPDGTAQGRRIAAGGGLVCAVGYFGGSVRFGDRTLIALGSADGFIACFEP